MKPKAKKLYVVTATRLLGNGEEVTINSRLRAEIEAEAPDEAHAHAKTLFPGWNVFTRPAREGR